MFFKILVAQIIPCQSFFTDRYPAAFILNWLSIVLHYSAASRRFLGILFVFLKLRIGYFSDTPKPPIIVAECPKIFDVQCISERILESLEKIFVLKYS